LSGNLAAPWSWKLAGQRTIGARVLCGLGHEVKLIASEAVRPFVKRGKKNDAADAAAICAAACRPDARFVAVKSTAQQGVLALHSARTLLVKQQTMLACPSSNALEQPGL
jgi:error-prone DNA polymerase